ncbi:YybH family protein [Thalassoglobus neptunius]|nr:DUF4440 domain-containing protein [Thalassoglobus neptunius]
MRRLHISFALAAYMSVTANLPAVNAQAKTQKSTTETEVVLSSARQFVKEFNAHNVDKLLSMYAPKAEIIQRDGSRQIGTKEIRGSFTTYFEQNPEAQIAVRLESVKELTPNLALEEGTVTLFDDGNTASYVSSYILLHSKVEGMWKIAVSKVTEDEILDRQNALDQLAWMEGEWIDEGATSSIYWNCQRSEDGNYLLRSFDIRFADGRVAKGTQRIGWDPVQSRIRSWAFDTSGGFAEATWSQVGEVWVNKSTGYQPDGTAVSATNYVIPIRGDRYLLRSVERIAGNEKADDVEAVVVRRGPKPAK